MEMERRFEMKQATWIRALAVAALVLVAPALSWAQAGDLAPRLVQEGWEQVGTHVFQRHLENGTVETVGWGLEIVAWELDQVRERIADLEARQLDLEEPSLELMDLLDDYRSRALELQAELDGEWQASVPRRLQSGELRSLAGAAGCNLVITRYAVAYPTTTGPAAAATAAFSDTCGTFGQVMAEAQASGYYNGAFRYSYERDPASGRRNGYGSASASASASVVATTDCWSEAIARVWVEDSKGNLAVFVKRATNDRCRVYLPPPPDECLSSGALQACPELP
jgi:hypothetical protein